MALRCLQLDGEALEEPRPPRVSWAAMPGSGMARKASQRRGHFCFLRYIPYIYNICITIYQHYIY